MKHMHFKKIRESNILKIMASLSDQKIGLEPCLLAICLDNSVSHDPENRSHWCLKTLKNGHNWAQNGAEKPENGSRGRVHWVDYHFTLALLIQEHCWALGWYSHGYHILLSKIIYLICTLKLLEFRFDPLIRQHVGILSMVKCENKPFLIHIRCNK